jgi:GDP-4-dehydro-6-deoxy-D-mannose reductase
MPSDAQPLPYTSVLVTGAEGFVGGWLTPVLRAALPAEARLVALARKPAAGSTAFVQADLLDREAIAQAVVQAGPDLIVHLAAQASVAQGATGAADTWAVNTTGTLNLARACASAGFTGTFLFVSSAEVYGRSFNDGIVTEGTPLAPQSAYARSKAAAEALLDDVLPLDAQILVVRPANHSGPHQDTRFVLPSFASQIAAIEQGAEPVLRVGNLDAERDFLDVRDVADAYVALLRAAPALSRRETFNIASGAPVSIGSLLQALLALTPAAIRIEQDPARMRPSEIAATRIDAGYLRSVARWHPCRSLDDMLLDLLDDARHQTDVARSR